jgi:Asp/Glu/hydantoin racemase
MSTRSPAVRLGFVHTVASLVPRFRELSTELLPEVDTFDIVDETLLRDATADGRVSLDVVRRLVGHAASAETHGADLVVVTCSSIGAAVDAVRPFARVPLVRIDSAMAERAVGMGSRIGILATLRSTLVPTAELIRTTAGGGGGTAEVRERLVEGAFGALRAGDTDRHDALVRDGLRDLLEWADVVVLAQASMARVADGLHTEGAGDVPILSSPRLGMERVRDLLSGG